MTAAETFRRFQLQPLTPAHVRILRNIDSPLILAAQLAAENREHFAQHVGKLVADAASGTTPTFEQGTIASLFILSTPFAKLKKLERMKPKHLVQLALATIPAPQSDDELCEMQRALGKHFGRGTLEIAKLRNKP